MRRLKKMSQTKLGKLVGVRQATISDWERGIYLPQEENIQKLAEVLGVELEVLEMTIKANYYVRQLKLLGCSPEDYEFLYEQIG